jgi:hypothetical protein
MERTKAKGRVGSEERLDAVTAPVVAAVWWNR